MAQVPNPPKLVPVNWTVMRTIGNLAWAVNQKLLGGNAKLPGGLVPAKLHARFKSLRYSNQKLKQCLGWTPKYGVEAAIARSLDDTDHFAVPVTTAAPAPEPVSQAVS